jgi:hypothetical protein
MLFVGMSVTMSDKMDIVAIRDAVVNGRVEWLNHSLQRMMERGMSIAAVKEVLSSGEVIEDYPDDSPYPSALILGWVENEPLHVVVAYDSLSQYCLVVTVYRPDLEHFGKDYKTRKQNG